MVTYFIFLARAYLLNIVISYYSCILTKQVFDGVINCLDFTRPKVGLVCNRIEILIENILLTRMACLFIIYLDTLF